MDDEITRPGLPDDSDETKIDTRTEGPSGASAGTVADYHLLQKVGEGGMGEVWLAEQTRPVRRRVALKIIKQGMDTQRVVARFEAERQALALMDHPCVAKVFDAGATPEGRPYFVMEYVPGIPITEHCDRNKLTTRERLDLFLLVCQGVQHAHQKAIIHRDLKPSNILVSVQDGRAVPKIIDFGVAKATAQKLTERTVFTELGVLIGTPEYMSPEQAELTGQDVDTRTDVYSLGVVLYELVVGVLPFESRELRSAGLDGIRRKILEQDPPKPSTRLSTLGEERSTDSALRRHVDVPTLRRQLKGDLDWITMKALEKDRSRRYGSPVELAADIDRHLHDQPVLAGPPSRAYRARKFTRRHRVGVAASTAGILILIVFAVTMTVQAGRIARERDRANREAETARRVSTFLSGLFSESDPRRAQGKELTAREVLQRGVDRIGKELEDQPAVKARLLRTLGAVHQRLGIHDKAEMLLQESLAMNRKLFGEDDLETLRSAASLAWLRHDQGRDAEAEKSYRGIVEAFERKLGEENAETLRAMSDLAVTIDSQGRSAEVEQLNRRILEIRTRTLGEDDPDTLTSLNNLGWVVLSQGRYGEAETLLRKAHNAQLKRLGPEHPDTQLSLANLSVAVGRQGRYAEAERLMREAFEANRRVFGENHSETIGSLTGLAGAVMGLGRFAEAEKLWRQAYEGVCRLDGEDSPDALYILGLLGMTIARQGRLAESETLLQKVVDVRRRVLGDDALETVAAWSDLGYTLSAMGRYKEAEAILRNAVETVRRVKGPDDGASVAPLANLAYAIDRQGRVDEAETLYRESVERSRRLSGAKSPRTARILYRKACGEATRGNRDQALASLKEASDAGFSEGIRDAKDLASLNGDPRFIAIADEVDRRRSGTDSPASPPQGQK